MTTQPCTDNGRRHEPDGSFSLGHSTWRAAWSELLVPWLKPQKFLLMSEALLPIVGSEIIEIDLHPQIRLNTSRMGILFQETNIAHLENEKLIVRNMDLGLYCRPTCTPSMVMPHHGHQLDKFPLFPGTGVTCLASTAV